MGPSLLPSVGGEFRPHCFGRGGASGLARFELAQWRGGSPGHVLGFIDHLGEGPQGLDHGGVVTGTREVKGGPEVGDDLLVADTVEGAAEVGGDGLGLSSHVLVVGEVGAPPSPHVGYEGLGVGEAPVGGGPLSAGVEIDELLGCSLVEPKFSEEGCSGRNGVAVEFGALRGRKGVGGIRAWDSGRVGGVGWVGWVPCGK